MIKNKNSIFINLKMGTRAKILWLLITINLHWEAKALRKKVCVIGAGPAGLSSLKQLSTWPDEFEPLAFEKSSQVGGQWEYTDKTDVDEHGLPIHSAVYKNLRVNLPKPQLQAFPDYMEFYGEERSYVKHQTLLEYVQNFTRHFDLHKYIKFNTLVENVKSHLDNKWIIKTRDLNTNQYEETMCDALMVCSGNSHTPNIPNIPGIETFTGRVLHSQAYRQPEGFANQTVVILGAENSGTDIGFEVSSVAKTVYLSHRHEKLKFELPSNVIEVPGVIAANGSQFILSNGSRIIADSIVFCTGYVLGYPFLDASSGIIVDKGKYVHPIYKHLINVEHPTMAIIGLLSTGFFFPAIYVRAHYFTSVLRGHVKLPSYAEMLKDSELPAGTPVSQAHVLALCDPINFRGVDYYEELANTSGAIRLPLYFKSMYFLSKNMSCHDKIHFRDYNYITYDDGRVERVPINSTDLRIVNV